MSRQALENETLRGSRWTLAFWLLAVCGGLTGAALHATEAPASAPPSTPPSFGVDTAIVRLDVVVRDKRGRVVRDLRASDFEVFEDRAEQALDSFRVFSKDEPLRLSVDGQAQEPTASTRADAADEPPSVMAFVFDRMSADARSLSRRAALAHVDAGQTRGSVVGVFSIDLALHVVEPFTTDATRVRIGLEHAAGGVSVAFTQDSSDTRRRIDEVVRSSESLQSMGQGGQGDPGVARVAAMLSVRNLVDMMEIHIQRASEALERDQQGFATINGLLGVIDVLERVPGRKAIVLLSEGLKLPANVHGRFRSVIAAANRAQVSIYALDAAGLRAKSPMDEAVQELYQISRLQLEDATNDFRLANGPMTQQLERSEELLRLDPRAGLGELADETGGFLIHGTNDPSVGLARIGEDLRFHYLLSYTPTNRKLDGRFRHVAVRVRRPQLEVQTRKGYFALAPGARSPAGGPEAQALAQLDRRPQPSALDVRTIALSFPEPNRPGLVPVLVEVPREALRYASTRAGERRADVTIVVRIKNERAQEVATLSDRFSLPPAEADRPRRPLQFYREVDLAPGHYTVESAAYDVVSRTGGVRTAALEVPEVSEHELRLSSLVLADSAVAAPAAGTEDHGPLRFGSAFLHPNLGQPLHKSASPTVGFFFTAYGDPRATAGPEAAIELRRGEQTLTTAHATLPALDAEGRVQHAGTVSLAALEPGAYTLAVTIRDGRRSDTRQTAFVVER